MTINFEFSGVVSAGGANGATSEKPWRVRFVSCSPGLKAQRASFPPFAALGAGLPDTALLPFKKQVFGDDGQRKNLALQALKLQGRFSEGLLTTGKAKVQ